MEFRFLKNKTFWKKAFKVSLFFQILLLTLVLVKTYLSGDIGGITVMRFLGAFAVCGICGLFVGFYLAIKDESL